MDSSMNSFISDQLHVAQQSRREKLRVQHCSPSRPGQYHVCDYASSLDLVQPVFNSNLTQAGDDMSNSADLWYHPASGPSEVVNMSALFSNSRNNAMEDQVSNQVISSLKPRVDNSLENYSGVWKNVSANSNSDNWNTDCIGRYRKSNNQGIVSDIPAFEIIAKQNTNIHHQSQFQQGNLNSETQLHYKNALSDGVTTAVIGLQPNERGGTCATWGSYGVVAEHVPHSPYGYQSDKCWNAEMSLLNSRENQVVVDSHSQRLSLSLSSYPTGSIIAGSQFGNSNIPQSTPLHNVASIAFQYSKPCSPNFIRSIGVGQGNPLKESVGPSTSYHRQTGPLGPFTGYATILKSSRFLKPAQQLLDEYCGVIRKHTNSSTRTASDSDIGKFGDLVTAVNSIASDTVTTNDIMGVSAATQQDSNEIVKGDSNNSRESLRPDYQDKKAKLLYMLEEVCRRYKQYYQQMQMVVSAFESAAGLAGATPYISYALKSVSGHFNHLKSVISDQLRHINTFLGVDFSLPCSGIREKRDFNSKRFKYTDHIFQKQKSGGSSKGLLEPQQQIWKPQRGLPERAVSVLRAWLFEHFLHPYPTDTDKHMLATQTGLTRSQVSNWFINARVRLWKPMVEEVHMLETKGVAERNKNSAEFNNVSTNADLVLNKMVRSSMPSVNLESPSTGVSYEMADVYDAKQHDQEKQSQVDTHNIPSIVERTLGISRYHQTGQELSELGSVSLTLGLKQSPDQFHKLESSYQHPPYLRQQDHLRQHLGGHTAHE